MKTVQLFFFICSSLEKDLLDIIKNNASVSWEAKSGCLSASRILFDASKASVQFADALQKMALEFLLDDEVRVRLTAGKRPFGILRHPPNPQNGLLLGEVLGSLCRFRGPTVYEACRQPVCDLIRDCLERQLKLDNEQSSETARLAGKLTRSGSFDEVWLSLQLVRVQTTSDIPYRKRQSELTLPESFTTLLAGGIWRPA